MTPENVVDELSVPVVKLKFPDDELVIIPAPEIEPIVSEKPFRSNVAPLLIVNALEFDILSEAVPNFKVPPETVVVPV